MRLEFTPCGYTLSLPDSVRAWAEASGSEMMDTGELIYLAGTLAAYPWDTEAIVVEIGAYVGRTTVFMAKTLQLLRKRVLILSIDPFERAQPDSLNPQGIYSAYLENIRTNNVADLCLPLAAFSEDAAPVVPDKIGVLVIDGAHHYPAVSKDLELYGPKVLPKGLIFIDDYGPAYPDVMRAVDEYFVPGGRFTILHRTHFVVAQRDAGAGP
jgi:Methyltransferase domain